MKQTKATLKQLARQKHIHTYINLHTHTYIYIYIFKKKKKRRVPAQICDMALCVIPNDFGIDENVEEPQIKVL